MTEQCWTIEEKLPIPVKVKDNGNIVVGAMLMTYERFQELGDNLNQEVIDYRLERKDSHGLGDITELMIKYPTGVSYFSYSYVDGKCLFSSPSLKDTENWLKLYEGIVERIP
jgi:hypothetical protein